MNVLIDLMAVVLLCAFWAALFEAIKWKRIARDLYNAHSGSAGQWERALDAYEKAVGK